MRVLFCLAFALSVGGRAPASDGLSDARAARSILGPSVWSRIARIENPVPRGPLGRRPYPKTVFALIFELSGILWFYTDADGTQSLSVSRGSLDADEADPGPLFLNIDAGFARWSWVDDRSGDRSAVCAVPPNGCFIASAAAYFRRIALGNRMEAPELLLYYVDTPGGRRGHTVLVFEAEHGLSAVDPDVSPRAVRIPAYVGSNPRSLAAYLRDGPIAVVRVLPIGFRARPSGPWAGLPSKSRAAT
jgi:hypothetical protein